MAINIPQVVNTKYNNEELNMMGAFASPVVMFENKDLVKPLIKLIYSKKIKGIDSNVAPDVKHNLIESKFNFLQEENKIISDTKEWFADCITKTINSIYKEEHIYDISFNESWYHITKKNGVHESHIHPNCSWCGIYYLRLGERLSGHTTFECPYKATYIDAGNQFIPNLMKLSPNDGTLVLFPSYLTHSQSLYKGKEDRIVIGFNSSSRFKEEQ